MNLNFLTLGSLTTIAVFGAPYVSAIFTQTHFSRLVNAIIAWVICVVFGVAWFFVSGGSLTGINSLSVAGADIGIIFGGSKLFYKQLRIINDPVLAFLKKFGGAVHPAPAPSSSTASSGSASSAAAAPVPAAVPASILDPNDPKNWPAPIPAPLLTASPDTPYVPDKTLKMTSGMPPAEPALVSSAPTYLQQTYTEPPPAAAVPVEGAIPGTVLTASIPVAPAAFVGAPAAAIVPTEAPAAPAEAAAMPAADLSASGSAASLYEAVPAAPSPVDNAPTLAPASV